MGLYEAMLILNGKMHPTILFYDIFSSNKAVQLWFTLSFFKEQIFSRPILIEPSLPQSKATRLAFQRLEFYGAQQWAQSVGKELDAAVNDEKTKWNGGNSDNR